MTDISAHSDVQRMERARIWAVVFFVALIVLVGWLYMGVMIAQMLPDHDMRTLGPGMDIFNFFNGVHGMNEVSRALFASLCLMPGASHLGMPALGVWGATDLGLVFIMWVAMSAGMMLPTALPMIMSYLAGGHKAGATLILSLGYLSVWIGFSVLATLAQWALTSAMILTPGMASASPVFAGSIFLLAGIYQFTPLKAACLLQCRTPFPLARAQPQGAYTSGMYQGLMCLGCCWALMLVMFAVGVMNIIWMAALGAVMAIEKLGSGRTLTFALGVVLLLSGAGLWLSLLLERGILRF